MSKTHHVIYIPGLDDQRKGYELIINCWKIYGVSPRVYRIGWKDGNNDFKPKLEKLVKEINVLIKQGNIVSLVGGSAGGSAALNALIEQPKINAVVNLCGRLRAGINVYPSLEKASSKSTSFKQSVNLFEKRESTMSKNQRSKVLTLSPFWDEVVPISTITISGAVNRILPSVGHMVTGFLGMTILSPLVIGFIKQKAKE
jgi:hypothetical protein